MTNLGNMPPLDGIKVIDATHVGAGPLCSSFLGQLGADVVKIEPMGDGELMRKARPTVGTSDISYYFASVNLQKRFVQLDLKSDEGQAAIQKLCTGADVLVTNFGPGVPERLGLDYETVSDLNPRIVHCSITGFRQDSDYADYPSFDYIHEAMAGVMSITGYEGQIPPLPGFPAADMAGAIYAVLGTVLALSQRDRTGLGQRVEVPLQDSLLSLMPLRLGYTFATDKPLETFGRLHRDFAPFGVFETADKPLVLTIGSEALWDNLLVVLPELEQERFRTQSQRVEHREILASEIEAALGEHPCAVWIERFREARVPAAPVLNTSDVAKDPYIDGCSVTLDVGGSPYRWITYPVQHSGFRIKADRTVRGPGADNADVLGESLSDAGESQS